MGTGLCRGAGGASARLGSRGAIQGVLQQAGAAMGPAPTMQPRPQPPAMQHTHRGRAQQVTSLAGWHSAGSRPVQHLWFGRGWGHRSLPQSGELLGGRRDRGLHHQLAVWQARGSPVVLRQRKEVHLQRLGRAGGGGRGHAAPRLPRRGPSLVRALLQSQPPRPHRLQRALPPEPACHLLHFPAGEGRGQGQLAHAIQRGELELQGSVPVALWLHRQLAPSPGQAHRPAPPPVPVPRGFELGRKLGTQARPAGAPGRGIVRPQSRLCRGGVDVRGGNDADCDDDDDEVTVTVPREGSEAATGVARP